MLLYMCTQEEEMYISFRTCWVQRCISFVIVKILKTEICNMEGLAYVGHKI